jgi:iron complex transport system permease protein
MSIVLKQKSSAAQHVPVPTRLTARLARLILTLLLILIFLLAIGIGAVPISPPEIMAILARQLGLHLDIPFEARQEAVMMVIRLPRVVAGLLIGSSLAVAGASIQGLFRNPLADPSLIGISSGSALAAALTIVLGGTVLSPLRAAFGDLLLPLAAFGGGVMTTLLVYRLATASGRTEVTTMLLAGIAINALSGAGIGLLTYMATDDQIRDITFWSLGSLGRASWNMLAVILPFMLLPLCLMPVLARSLNAFLLGEAEAGHLGIHVERIKTLIVVLVAMTVGAGVSMAGMIGFVGLVVPHLIRLVIGPDHRNLLPGSALLGASLLIGADLLARTVAVPAEVPIGIVTSAVGGPFFLWLLLRERRKINA